MRGASRKVGNSKDILLRVCDKDILRAVEVKQLLRLYKASHNKRSVFDALAAIVEKEAAKLKLPK